MIRPWWTVVVAGVLACGTGGDRTQEAALADGRRYTSWLYAREYDKLWERFSPELRRTFGSTDELADFAGRALVRLGSEQGTPAEEVTGGERDRIYSRVAAFDRAAEPVVIQWTLADDGAVTGFVVRPAADTTGR